MTTATLKNPRRRRRARDLRDATLFQNSRPTSDAPTFDPKPPFDPPECLKNRKPGERLTNSEHIEALEWLIACIRESARQKGLNL